MAPTVNRKGGDIVRIEPRTLTMVNSSPAIRVAFENAGCIPFCQMIQKVGYHTQLASLFALNLKNGRVKLGDVEIVITEKLIADATGLPTAGEKWFKGDELDISAFKEFVKPEFRNEFATTFPTAYLQDHHSELLKVVQRYFTCEGRFSRAYQYHLRLLLHFTDKKPMNLSYFLLKSLERMATKVQVQRDNHMSSLFHFSLIRILVKFALEKKKLQSSNFLSNLGLTPQAEPSSIKTDEKEQEECDVHEGKATPAVKGAKVVEAKGIQHNKRHKGKHGKQPGKKQVLKGKEKLQESKEQVPTLHITKFQVAAGETVRVKKDMEEAVAQAAVEASDDHQEIEMEQNDQVQPKEDPNVTEMKEALAIYQLKILFLEKQNRELTEAAKQTAPQRIHVKIPSRSAEQDKGKQVAVEAQLKELKVESSRPTTRSAKMKQGWVQQMKEVAQSSNKSDFDQWKEYQRYLEELEECQMQAMRILQHHEDYEHTVQHLFKACDKELRNSSTTMDTCKHFVKWTLPARRQNKALYVRNLVLKRKLRYMKKSLTRAWRLVKKYREAAGIPPPGDRPSPRTRVKPETKHPQPVASELKDTVPDTSKVKAPTSKVYSKRKKR